MPADAISIISAAFVTVTTAILGYLKARDSMEFKRINDELESAKIARAESQKDREELRQSNDRILTELADCHAKHTETDRRATRMEVELSFLKQQMQSRPA